MRYILLIMLTQSVLSRPQEFIAPVFELGSYIPPLSPTGPVEPGKPPTLPAIDLENRIGDEDQKTQVPPLFVLGSKPEISSIPVWEPIQIIPPGKPWPSGSTEKVEITSTTSGSVQPSKNNSTEKIPSPPSLGDKFGENEDKVTSLDYKPTKPSYHPNPGNNVQQIIPPGPSWPAVAPQSTQKPGITTLSPSISLEYKPQRPSYHPSPGNTIQQIIPSGEPWPAKYYINVGNEDEDYYSPEDVYAGSYYHYVPGYPRPAVVLDYKPNRPFYAGKPKE